MNSIAMNTKVLQLVAEGRNMAEIAKFLCISKRTVEKHKYSMMDKLQLRNTAEITQYAVKRGLINNCENVRQMY